jgi:hypothetical protein
VILIVYTGRFSVQLLCLCFITTDRPAHDARGRLGWLQDLYLLIDCSLLVVLIEQLEIDRCPDSDALVTDIPDQRAHRPTILGGMGWQHLIARCFEDTAETAFIMSAQWR